MKTNLAALRDSVGLFVLMGTHTKVLNSLARVALAAKQDGVGTSGRTERKLVQGKGFTTSRKDARLSRSGEAQCSNAELGNFQETHVVGDGANCYDNFGIAVRGIDGVLDYP